MRLRQRLPRGRERRRARRRAGATATATRTIARGSARTRATTAALATSSAIASSSAWASLKAIRQATRATDGQARPYSDGRAVPRQDTYGYPDGYGPACIPIETGIRIPTTATRRSYGPGRYGSSAAYPNGLNDGIEKGREDARKRRSYDPLRHDWYRDGDRHYRGEYGPKQLYKTSIARASRKATSAAIGSSDTIGELIVETRDPRTRSS